MMILLILKGINKTARLVHDLYLHIGNERVFKANNEMPHQD